VSLAVKSAFLSLSFRPDLIGVLRIREDEAPAQPCIRTLLKGSATVSPSRDYDQHHVFTAIMDRGLAEF
jgi:hypothetical protein